MPGVTGRAVTGLFVDERHNYLFASGAGSGQGFVFDARTGATLATYQLAVGAPTFVNDVVVTKQAAYFTDSNQPFIYKVPLGHRGELPDQSAVERIPLSGDFQQVPGFNSNGIEASSNGKWLLIVQSATGQLHRVDPQDGCNHPRRSGRGRHDQWRRPALAGEHPVRGAKPSQPDRRHQARTATGPAAPW